jgi:hypothetical protein
MRPAKRWENAMSAMSQIRSTLQRQLKTLDSNQRQGPVDIPDEMRETTVNHIKQWLADIISLLKETPLTDSRYRFDHSTRQLRTREWAARLFLTRPLPLPLPFPLPRLLIIKRRRAEALVRKSAQSIRR